MRYYIIQLLLWTVCFYTDLLEAVMQPYGRSYLDIFNVLRLNPNARLGIGVQITVPVSVFMPDLGVFGRQSRSFYSLSPQYLWNPKSSSIAQMPICPTQKLSLGDYLSLLQIDVEPCQERFICEITSDPAKFQPLAKLFLDKLIVLEKWSTCNSQNLDFYYLLDAYQTGKDPNQDCEVIYKSCPVPAASMINMNLLWAWELLTKMVNIKFIGELDS